MDHPKLTHMPRLNPALRPDPLPVPFPVLFLSESAPTFTHSLQPSMLTQHAAPAGSRSMSLPELLQPPCITQGSCASSLPLNRTPDKHGRPLHRPHHLSFNHRNEGISWTKPGGYRAETNTGFSWLEPKYCSLRLLVTCILRLVPFIPPF